MGSISIVRMGITCAEVDAVVNAANEGLRAGGGVCGAIFEEAGRRDMQAACDAIGHVAKQADAQHVEGRVAHHPYALVAVGYSYASFGFALVGICSGIFA